MKDERLPDREVERLLREALRDDLPAELEAELLRGLRPAWGRAARAAEPLEEPARPRRLEVAWRSLALALPRRSLAAAALVAFVAGVALHVAVPSRGLAGPLRLSREAAATAVALGRVAAMTAVVEMPGPDGRPRLTRVAWSAVRAEEARLSDADGADLGVVGAAGGESLLDLASRRSVPREPVGGLARADLAAVGVVASPRRLAALLSSAWEDEPGPGPGTAAFRVRSAEGVVSVTVDPRTSLPTRIVLPPGTRVRLEWKIAAPPLLLGGAP